jgi:hypothetical protein
LGDQSPVPGEQGFRRHDGGYFRQEFPSEPLAFPANRRRCSSVSLNRRSPSCSRRTRFYAKYEAPVNQGDIDFARVVKILRSAGYAGDLCVENEHCSSFPKLTARRFFARRLLTSRI